MSRINQLPNTSRLISQELKILLLEDDAVDAELVSTLIKNGGIAAEFTYAIDYPSYVACLREKDFDMILADYHLPEFDGITALAIAQSTCPDVPFILVSGVLGEETAVEAMQRGATDYVLKQRLERLLPAVRRALRERETVLERQSLARALQQTDNLLQTVIESSPVSIITLNRKRRVIVWNAAAERLYRWTATDVVDQPLPVIPESEQTVFDDCFARSLQNQATFNLETQHLRQDGSLIDVNLSLAPLQDETGQVYGAVMTSSDITQRKQIEDQRRHLLAQESAARVAAESASQAKDNFLAVLSHELRTPLNAITGWIQLVRKKGSSPEFLQRALDTIYRNAIAQSQLIEDLLDFSRIIHGQVDLKIQTVDISTLLKATVDTVRPAAAAKSIQIELDLADAAVNCMADPARLQQTFLNLLSNAIKFTPPSGPIAVRVESDGSQVQIQVKDSGEGIAPDFLPHVFEHFRQADGSFSRSKGGLGLGLAISRHIIELHGGSIVAESPGLGKGATFTVKLPVRAAEANRPKPEPNSASDLRNIKVLVVDDEADSRELLVVLLQEHGAAVQAFDSAEAAYDALFHFVPHIILCDLGLPGEDGLSLINRIRSLPDPQLREIPAIAVTAYAQSRNQEQALAAGYQDFYAKPFDTAEIPVVVHRLAYGLGSAD